MRAKILKPIRVKSTGEKFFPRDVIDIPEEKAREWAGRGLVSLEPDQTEGDQPILESGHKAQITPLPERVGWESPLLGKLSGGPVLEMGPDTFSIRHPLTGERVTLPNEWLASLDERSAIIEHDGGLPREEADKQARTEFLKLFGKKGADHAKRS